MPENPTALPGDNPALDTGALDAAASAIEAAAPAPVEQLNSSPTDSGTNESSAPESPAAEAPSPESPAPVDAIEPPPAEQPALPGPDAFNGHGQPGPAVTPPVEERKGVYVDAEGKSHVCKIAGKRKDGSFDLTIPATIGDIRIDGVQRKQDEGQVGGYVVI